MPVATLPTQFTDLERLVPQWAVGSEIERLRIRSRSPMEELKDVYGALEPRMDEILTYLDATPIAHLTPEQRTLFQLAQAFFEVSLAVELFGEPDNDTMADIDRLTIDIDAGKL